MTVSRPPSSGARSAEIDKSQRQFVLFFSGVRITLLRAGSIPPELGNLVELESLKLFQNQLTGDLCVYGGRYPSNWFHGFVLRNSRG